MGKRVRAVRSGDRISSIDILRGFALLGIVLVNILGFNATFFDFGGYYNNLPDETQQHFYNIYISLTADKFIFLFSFLYGYGIFIQYHRFQKRGQNFPPFFTRRMSGLALFGVLHIVLLWAGDILFLYAIAGMILLLLRRLKTAWLLLLALFFYFFIGIWLFIDVWLPLPDAMSSTCTECLSKAIEGYASGNYADALWIRLHEYAAFRYINLFYYLPKIIGISLFGFIASKFNLHQLIKNSRKKWALTWVAISVMAVLVYFNYEKMVDFESPFANAVYMSGYELMNILIATSWIVLILIVGSVERIAGILKPVALVGRASLTNYLMQSLILSVIFYGWGFGMIGQTNVKLLALIALLVYALQLIINMLWFTYYDRGPLERLWRKWSYGG